MANSKYNKKSHKNSIEKYIGKGAFALGITFAFVLGFLGTINGGWIIFLIIIGLLIGLLNISEKETTSFLVSGVILIFISVLGGSAFYDVQFLSHVLDALIMIFIPAIVIVAMKNIFNLAKD